MTGISKRQFMAGAAAVFGSASCVSASVTPDNTEAQSDAPSSQSASASTKQPTHLPGLAQGMDGVAMAAAVRKGDVSALELVDAAIERAQRVEPNMNAIVSSYFEEARETAKSKTYSDGPLAGVPTFMKDAIDWKGHVTRVGSRAYVNRDISDKDHFFAASWRKSGVISLGKSTVPEFSLLASCQSYLTGATRNPWDLSRDVSGSSGGAAALVAARVVPFAHASDGGGSIRNPASVNGVFGFKASRLRLQDKEVPGNPSDFKIGVQHAVTVTVRDSIELFKIAEGESPFGYLGEVQPLSRPLRIGYFTDSPRGTPVDPMTVREIEETAKLCEDLGHRVEPFAYKFDVQQFSNDFFLLWSRGAAGSAKAVSEALGKPISEELFEPWTLSMAKFYADNEQAFPAAFQRLAAFQPIYEKDIGDFDVILSPVTGRPATPLGLEGPGVDFETLRERLSSFAAFTPLHNASGAPSMSVPLGLAKSDLPIGSLFSAKYGQDQLLFELALQLEEAKNWHNTVPSINAL